MSAYFQNFFNLSYAMKAILPISRSKPLALLKSLYKHIATTFPDLF